MAYYRKRYTWTDETTKERLHSEAAANAYLHANPGASLKKKPVGWQCRIRRQGQKGLVKSAKTKLELEQWASTIESQLFAGTYQDTRKAQNVLLATVLDEYRDKVTANKAASVRAEEPYRIKRLKDRLGHLPIQSDMDEFLDYVLERREEVGTASIRKELGVLSGAYRTAQVNLKLKISINPILQLKEYLRFNRVLDPTYDRTRRLEEGEESLLLGHHHSGTVPIKAIIQFALATTMRRGEIVAMKWTHINWKKSTLVIPVSKTDRQTGICGRTIPLQPAALDVLNSLPGKKEAGAVWGDFQIAAITRVFGRMCKKLKIENLHFHDLRREATTRLFEAGWSLEQVAMFTGHRDWKCLKIYTNIRPEDIAAQMAKGTIGKARQQHIAQLAELLPQFLELEKAA